MDKKNIIERYYKHSAIRIDDHDAICNEDDLVNALEVYCKKEKLTFLLVEKSMTPIVLINDVKYVARLDNFFTFLGKEPTEAPAPLPYLGRSLGYRPIFLYPYEIMEEDK